MSPVPCLSVPTGCCNNGPVRGATRKLNFLSLLSMMNNVLDGARGDW